jgi:hypothetical protein
MHVHVLSLEAGLQSIQLDERNGTASGIALRAAERHGPARNVLRPKTARTVTVSKAGSVEREKDDP